MLEASGRATEEGSFSQKGQMCSRCCISRMDKQKCRDGNLVVAQGQKVRRFPKSVLFIPQAEVEYFLPTYLIFVEIFKTWDQVETHRNLMV